MGTKPQARLTVSTQNFISLLSANFMGKKTDHAKVWAPVQLLPAGVIVLSPKEISSVNDDKKEESSSNKSGQFDRWVSGSISSTMPSYGW
jgi:hypothetical protein